MIPGMFGVDILSELNRLLIQSYELLIPSPVFRELIKISKRGKPKERLAARVGINLTGRGKIIKVKGPADEAILKLAGERSYIVGTTDSLLRKELRRRGAVVVYLRDRSHLEMDGLIIK